MDHPQTRVQQAPIHTLGPEHGLANKASFVSLHYHDLLERLLAKVVAHAEEIHPGIMRTPGSIPFSLEELDAIARVALLRSMRS